jgi:hypothetical protein
MKFFLKTQEVCGSFESEAMIESIKILDNELIDIKNAALSSSLKPLPGENVTFFNLKDVILILTTKKLKKSLKYVSLN